MPQPLRSSSPCSPGWSIRSLWLPLSSRGGKAIGLSGADGGLIQAKIENPELGYVGEVVKVNPEPVKAVLSAGYIPVIAPSGFRVDGGDSDPVMLLNINGDVVASEIAGALKAERLIFLTDVPGVRDGEGKFLPRLSAAEAKVNDSLRGYLGRDDTQGGGMPQRPLAECPRPRLLTVAPPARCSPPSKSDTWEQELSI